MTPESPRDASPAVPSSSFAPDPFVRNLVLLVVLSVGVSGWLLAYTDWFAEISGLIALGGLFTWIGALSKLLNKERTEQLQAWVERAVFGSQTLSWRLVLLAVVFVALASFTGTIDVRSQGDVSSRLLWFAFDAKGSEPAERLEPAGRVRAPWLTSWWSPAHVRVKVSGYPSLVATVQPWQRVQLISPGSFLMNPVILLVPTPQLAQFSRDTQLHVTVDGKAAPPLRFDGHSVWIGCEDDVRVPEAILSEWRSTGVPAEMVAVWQVPRAVNVDLHGGSAVTISINHDDGTPFVPASVINVRTPVRPEDFPQREVIDVPKP